MLSDDAIDLIRAEIDKSKLSIQSMKDDLLDHFCCVIEAKMESGLSFEHAYEQAFLDICPNGLDEIQKETILLLNSKRIMTMKKLIYLIGLLASVSISLGWLFKLLYWPGGGELFTYGFLTFVLMFMPLLAIDQFKSTYKTTVSGKIKLILGFSSAFVCGLSVLLKMLSLQGASLMLISGAILFTFGFLPLQFFQMYKKSLE